MMKIVIDNLYEQNKGDGKSLTQLPSEWWHFSIGEVTNPGRKVYP